MFDIESTGQRIGDLEIMLPPNIYHEKEVELADTFVLEYEGQDQQLDKFSGRYYIIVLNKGETKKEQTLPQEELQEQALK